MTEHADHGGHAHNKCEQPFPCNVFHGAFPFLKEKAKNVPDIKDAHPLLLSHAKTWQERKPVEEPTAYRLVLPLDLRPKVL